MSISNRRAANFENILVEAIRNAGWRVQRSQQLADVEPDLFMDVKGRRYAIKVKTSSEGRRDRLIPLLSQAILQAQTIARNSPRPVVPVAIVAAERVPAVLAGQITEFGHRHAPDAGVGVIDAEGLRLFAGQGLEILNSKPIHGLKRRTAPPKRLPNLFSDLNQWLLKVLLGQRLSDSLVSVPRGIFRNATQLAEAAGVSLMSAFRFVSQLENEGFLDRDGEALHLVRVVELLERWVSANRQPVQEIPARWIIKRDMRHLYEDLAKYVSQHSKANPGMKGRGTRVTKIQPRCCVGLFAAADALGFGFVRGVPPHLYLEGPDEEILRGLGLMMAASDDRADVLVRIPANREAIFRAAVLRDGLPVSDVLQVWLDVSVHPARGREQAAEIHRKALAPLLGTK